PHSNIIRNNLYMNNVHDPNILQLAIDYAEDISNNIEVASDPGFFDPANQNYGITPGSSILTQLPGLADIDFDEIGLQIDAYRTSIAPANLDFHLANPVNGATDVVTQDIVFSWDPADDADNYTLRIATDPEM